MNTIELVPAQQKALDSGGPVRAVDPRTNSAYVLIREDAYDKLKEMAGDDSPWTNEEMDSLAAEAGEMLDRFCP